MKLSDFSYDLPEALIAQKPLPDRDACRHMTLDRKTGQVTHGTFRDVLEALQPGDCLVLNDSKVLPARLYGTKAQTGANIEFLLIRRKEGDDWETMVRPGRRLKPGDRVIFSETPGQRLAAEILDYGEDGTRIVRFTYDGLFMERLEEQGSMPLPPYIQRPAGAEDKATYQTVYAREDGSVAAPTAGLHFTDDLLAEVQAKGVDLAYVTLHVGIGTFRPVKVENIEDHHMHFEEYQVTQEAADTVNACLDRGGRIVCVGTTSTRTIESAAVWDQDRGRYRLAPGAGSTGIFIYPGYAFRLTQGLITNFHLPGSTLLMLISALAGREPVLAAYEEAVKAEYRFFSYGDAMLIR